MSSDHLDHPVVLAYNYTGKLMLLDYSNNPFKNYRIFKTKTAQLDSVIHANPKKIELRLLRYAVQNNCPSFLKYNTHISNDLELIKSLLSKENEALQYYIKTILTQFKNERSRNSS